LKDNLCYKDHQVTASSKILEGFTSLYTSTAVQRLLDEDAIIIGRLSCDEFAMGSSNEKSVHGPVLNPVNEKCVPGGSSGGSAAAVAADLCLATLGSDTGGSIRQPAAYTNIVASGSLKVAGGSVTYGIASLEHNGAGAFNLSFSVTQPDTNYIVIATAVNAESVICSALSKTTSTFSIRSYVTENVYFNSDMGFVVYR
jgi:aspartyl-tRNA(Asn)/glutamyl-tRNA(Gln) amidotransferase subunit A